MTKVTGGYPLVGVVLGIVFIVIGVTSHGNTLLAVIGAAMVLISGVRTLMVVRKRAGSGGSR
jgi:hypothetical protein